LAEAFGIYGTATSAPRYPDLLINIACVAPMFITRLEKWLEDFVKNPNIQRHDLPPLDRVQRQCVHELAKFYGIGTESSGSEDRKQRAVTLIKRRDCKPPSIALTTVANVTGLHDASASSSGAKAGGMMSPFALDSAPSCTLHIYDLHKGILTNTIHSFLSAFPNEYTLQWVDDENCLAIFKDSNRMQRALNTLQPRGTFKVKPYQDIIPEPVSSGMVSLGSTSSAWKTPEPSSSLFSAAPSSSSPSPTLDNANGPSKPKGAAEKPTSAWGRPVQSGTSNSFSVLGDASSAVPATRTAVGRQGMWDYGEPEVTRKHSLDEATASLHIAPPSPSPSPEPTTTSSKPAVADWSELVDEDDEPSPQAE
jgi:hypothetical protein